MTHMPAIDKMTTPMNPFALMAGLRRLALMVLLALPLAAAAADQQTFATPEAAVDALIAARPHVGVFVSRAWLAGLFAEPPLGVEPMPMSQPEFAKFQKEDIDANVALVKAAGIPTQ